MTYAYEAKKRVTGLIEALETLLKRDPEQEVGTFALPVFDAVVEEIKAALGPSNPVVAAAAGIISPETVEMGEPIRAADALLVAKMLDSEIGPYPITVA